MSKPNFTDKASEMFPGAGEAIIGFVASILERGYYLAQEDIKAQENKLADALDKLANVLATFNLFNQYNIPGPIYHTPPNNIPPLWNNMNGTAVAQTYGPDH